MAASEQATHPPLPLPPHVLIFPFPAQGHVNVMLKLAELLSLSGLRVTFLNIQHIHDNLLRYTDVEARFSRFPEFRFRTIPDGLPAAHNRSFRRFMELIDSMKSVTKPLFKEMLVSGQLGSNLACIILDGLFNFIIDVNEGLEIPIFSFRTVSACSVWVYFWVHKLIEDGQLPIKGKEDMDRIIKQVPGMENLLRCRDLPGFCRAKDPNDPMLQFCLDQSLRRTRAHSLIFNSFEGLEGPILSRIQTLCPNVYTIGPLHAHLKTRLSDGNTTSESESESESSNGLWEVDRSCLAWLDDQPPKSVVYVSFGSIVFIGNHELMEFWHGLVNSGRRFLWVIRPDLVTGKDGKSEVPAEVEEGTRKRGLMVGWAPQEKVLAHKAIGGFLTHGGWNSTLESIAASVPMICWSDTADQQVNSRFVSHVWKLGLDMKDLCDRETVVKMVNDVLVNRREEFMRSAVEMADSARRSVNPGGSSYVDFDRLVEDIRLLSQPKAA